MLCKTLIGSLPVPFTNGMVRVEITSIIENDVCFFELQYYGQLTGKTLYKLRQDRRANWIDMDNSRSYETNEGPILEGYLNEKGRSDLIKKYEQIVEENGNIIEIFS